MKNTLRAIISCVAVMCGVLISGCAASVSRGQPERKPSASETEGSVLPQREPKEWIDALYEQVDELEYTFEASNGRKIFGYQWLPQGAETPQEGFPAIIFVHGYNSRSKNMKIDASYFVKRGFACFAFDFCGGNTLKLSDGNFEDMTVDTEIDDLNEIWSHVISRDFVDRENIFFFGASFGGTVTLLTLVQRQLTPKGVVLEYPAFNMAELAFTGERGWMGKIEKFIEAAKAYHGKMEDYYRKFNFPVLILHGDNDSLVNLSYSVDAIQYLPNAKLEIIEGGGHTFNWDENENIVWPLIFDFLVGCYS